MIDFYSIFTLLIVLTAVFSYVNHRFIGLPSTIGIMLISLIASLAIVTIGSFQPAFRQHAESLIRSIDFEHVLMDILLSFLLFAGAIHVDFQKLKAQALPIASFATIGVIISTAVIGVIMFYLFQLFQLYIPLIYCLLFGALISPTDPIAVLGILKEAKIPSALETKIAGESLFNDGVGVVIFLSILEIARVGLENLSAAHLFLFFIKEAGGGIAWGLLLGYAGYRLMKSIDHYQVEVLLTLAIVMGGYLVADLLHISGPLAMVVAGIFIGNRGKRLAMSDTTREYLDKFWELIDEILNAVLFLLIGFELLVLSFNSTIFWIGSLAILIVLTGRLISVSIPSYLLSFRRSFEPNTIPILTWGGLRGGISVALALSLPATMYRNEFVAITYIIVIFSILVQGLTIGKFAKKLTSKQP